MTDKISNILDSKTKKLRIELPDYHFSHSLSEESHFVGRKKISAKLNSLIADKKNKTGVYLVTGNRGVGKTSLVNKVVNETQQADSNLISLYINFGHNLTEKDILRLIVYELNAKFKEKKISEAITQELKELKDDIINSTEREREITIKDSGSIAITIPKTDIGFGIGNEKGKGKKTKKTRGIADTREIEIRLQSVLEKIEKDYCRIIIVFDELDKVEQGENSNTKASMFSINATREKQFEILKILSNMKYFLSTAKAKFIFIAGREMYDMYLADVSERSNHIGSIFNTVIYVPSFLTDKADNVHSDITSLTEEFVCRNLIPCAYQKIEHCNLKDYQEYLVDYIYGDKLKNEKKKTLGEKQQELITLKKGEKISWFKYSLNERAEILKKIKHK